jgi:hypothetical protein
VGEGGGRGSARYAVSGGIVVVVIIIVVVVVDDDDDDDIMSAMKLRRCLSSWTTYGRQARPSVPR